MPLNVSAVKKILVISLTNIGDVILTLPVVDILRRDFQGADISIVIGPKAETLLADNSKFKKVYVYDKRQAPIRTVKWVLGLRHERFDLVVDLRNSMTPFLIAPKHRTPAAKIKQQHMHMKEKHLKRLASVHSFSEENALRETLDVSSADKSVVEGLLRSVLGDTQKTFIVIAPGSAYHAKRWSAAHFADVIAGMQKASQALIFVGDSREDAQVIDEINTQLNVPVPSLAGKTTLIQLADVIKRARLVLTNDSAPMHLASYLNRPVLALFGPSDPEKYGPWSVEGKYLKAPVRDGRVDINHISPDEVLAQLNFESTSILNG